jgi:hypothetical protein
MRLKLIAIFSVVVMLVGGLSYGLARAMLAGDVDPAVATRALTAATAQLRVEGLATERWISGRVMDPKVRQAFSLGTPQAKGEAATEASNTVRDAASTSPDLPGVQPALVALTDENGIVLGRNGSQQMRGDDLAKVYPGLKKALDAGVPGSDIWVNRARNEQLFASYAPVRGEDGKLLGALVVATVINDERMSSASDKTSGEGLLLAVKGEGDAVQVIAKSSSAGSAVAALESKSGVERVNKIMETGQTTDIPGFPDGATAVGRPLDGYGDGRRAVVVSTVSPKGGALASRLMWPILGVTALGVVMVIVFASLLDAWISRPIQEIEDGLLAIINGKTDLRFELEHPMLGGLAFRINSLLNQLFGIQEEETDAEGRVLAQGPGAGAPPPEAGAAEAGSAEPPA